MVSWLIGIGVIALLVLIGYFLVAWRAEQDEVEEGRRPPEIEARIRIRDELPFGRLRRLRDELYFRLLRRLFPESEAPIHYYGRPPRPYSPPRTPEAHPQVERHEIGAGSRDPQGLLGLDVLVLPRRRPTAILADQPGNRSRCVRVARWKQ